MPRVISGTAKGTQLKTLDGEHTRPTSDRTKEAIFSILNRKVHEAEVLDLCAGTGQLGLEALSRGASFVCFVDHSSKAMKVVKENSRRAHFEEQSEFMSMNLLKALKLLEQSGRTFDLIFFDPPYLESRKLMECCEPILARILRNQGILIWEEASQDFIEEEWNAFVLAKRCKYGAAMVSFYSKEKAKIEEEMTYQS